MRDRPLAQEDIQNIYELSSIRFGPIPGSGWSMASRYFYRCPECGYLMQEGPVLRSAIVELIGRLDLQVYAVLGSAPSRHQIELVREECLRELFRSVRHHDVERVVIESRERSTRVVGQNRRDFGTLIEARHAGELHPTVHYEWAPKEDPLVWLADAVAGAVLAAERGEADWLRLLGEATRTVVVRLPS